MNNDDKDDVLDSFAVISNSKEADQNGKVSIPEYVNDDDEEDVPYTRQITLRERQEDQDHDAREFPRVQDPHVPKVWADRRHVEDDKGTACDRGHDGVQDEALPNIYH